MKNITIFFSLLLLISISASNLLAADIEMSTGVQYNWFNSNNDGSATQTLMPVQLSWQHGDFDVAIATAYVTTKYDPESGDSYSMDGLIDTQATIGYQINDRLPFDILLGLDVNLPTGMTNLSAEDTVFTKHDDHLTVTTFGEGWNFNPSLVIVKDWQRFSIGAGVGYAFRGEYDFSETVQKFNPGDRLTVSAEINYEITKELLSKVFITHSEYGKDKVDGYDYFREGDFNLVGLSMQYFQNDWDASVSFRTIRRGKAEKWDWGAELNDEEEKSFDDEYLIDLLCHYTLDKTVLKASLQYKLVEENNYPAFSRSYSDKKEKTTLSIGVSRPLTETLSGNITVAGFHMNEGKPYPWAYGSFTDEEKIYRGGSISVGVSGRF
jgi:hypothetical protein